MASDALTFSSLFTSHGYGNADQAEVKTLSVSDIS
jgi:hypothetical protein